MSARPLRVLVAPDKFKGTLTGAEAAAAVAAGVRAALPGAEVTAVPFADGGEGTVEAVLAVGGKELVRTVPGPLGEPVQARLVLRGTTAVVEAAQACGLQLLEPTPGTSLSATSAGVGELLRTALAAGATSVVVGLGGVACTDGGAGMASALGARLLGPGRRPLGPGGGALVDLVSINLDHLLEVVARARFVAATDVTNPLLGPDGAAAVYGPQKGAGPEEVALLEQGLERWADLVERARGSRLRDMAGAGAAGGLGWGLATLLGAEVRSGAELLIELLGLHDALSRADLVITGEGRLDRQSTFGKGPVALARAAATFGVPVLGVAGVIDEGARDEPSFTAVASLVERAGKHAALTDTATVLAHVVERAVGEMVAGDGRHGQSRPRSRFAQEAFKIP